MLQQLCHVVSGASTDSLSASLKASIAPLPHFAQGQEVDKQAIKFRQKEKKSLVQCFLLSGETFGVKERAADLSLSRSAAEGMTSGSLFWRRRSLWAASLAGDSWACRKVRVIPNERQGQHFFIQHRGMQPQ